MLRPAARKGAFAGALACALFVGLGGASPARAEDDPARAYAAAVATGDASAHRAIRLGLTGRRHARAARGASLAGVSAPLAAKAREIVAACGARVVSGLRRTRVAGTRRMSLHASGRAVDLAGDPDCIYARLRGWSGGVSIDYGAVGHVHISLGGREDGRRFAHNRVTRRAYARRHRLRVATR
jgi:hypothetical protein